jgi:hypothetical protein
LAVKETTYAGGSQIGVAIWHAGVPLHDAFSPSAHLVKFAGQPLVGQSQATQKPNTE